MPATARPSRQKWAVISIAAVVLAAGLAAGVRYIRRHVLPADYYQVEVQWQAQRSRQLDGAIVFLGDSQTAGFATSSVAARAENFGISGDLVDRAIWRIPKYRLNGAKAIVVEFGINDLWMHQTHRFEQRYEMLLALLPPGVPVYAMAVFPLAATGEAALELHDTRQRIPALNKQIAAACRQRPGCRYVDMTKALSGPDGYLRPEYAEADGVHLSAAGYRVWAAGLGPLLPE